MIWLKRIFYFILLIALLFAAYIGFFIYRAKVGLPLYETKPHELNIPEDKPAVLIFSKTNGFVHSKAIEASLEAYRVMAEQNGWYIYETKDAGVFNPEQLAQFKTTVWNNVSGNVLTKEQRDAFKEYLTSGGGFLGIHAAGDGSHSWEWYQDKLINAKFSHHPIKNQIQAAKVGLEMTQDSSLWTGLVTEWSHQDEWYIFYDNARQNGATVLYSMDGESIDPNGVLGPIQKSKTFGMGKDHPVVWYNYIGRGRSVYSIMGHTAAAFSDTHHLEILENAIRWTGGL